MLNKFYDFMMQQAESKNAPWVLACISFIESSFFPFPPDPVLAIVVAKNRHKTLFYALLCTFASVLGGFLGYYIGYAFFALIGEKILAFYGLFDKFNELIKNDNLNTYAFWIICAKGLTPIPYKIVTIACGVAKIDLLTFASASIITRSLRFILLSFICKFFGDAVLRFIDKHKKLTIIIIIASILIGFLLVKFLVK